jgi:hypothetical protein
MATAGHQQLQYGITSLVPSLGVDAVLPMSEAAMIDALGPLVEVPAACLQQHLTEELLAAVAAGDTAAVAMPWRLEHLCMQQLVGVRHTGRLLVHCAVQMAAGGA